MGHRALPPETRARSSDGRHFDRVCAISTGGKFLGVLAQQHTTRVLRSNPKFATGALIPWRKPARPSHAAADRLRGACRRIRRTIVASGAILSAGRSPGGRAGSVVWRVCTGREIPRADGKVRTVANLLQSDGVIVERATAAHAIIPHVVPCIHSNSPYGVSATSPLGGHQHRVECGLESLPNA